MKDTFFIVIETIVLLSKNLQIGSIRGRLHRRALSCHQYSLLPHFSLSFFPLVLLLRVAQLVAAWKLGWEKMQREWGNFLIFSLYPPSLSISYIKNCLILPQNVRYGTFVANVKKNLTYALWENNSGSNSLWESCEGLLLLMISQIRSFLALNFFPAFVASFDLSDRAR